MFIAPVTQADTPLTCNMQTFAGEDDTAHQMDLPFSLYLGNTDYNRIYLTTNATMTFGQPDATFHAYPQTPSVSLAGWDWDTWGDGAYVSYGYTQSSFCIEWSVRPFPQSTGDLTQIRLVVQKYADGHWHGEIVTFGWLPDNNRRGIVATQGGTPLPIEAAFDVNGGTPVEVEPAPVPTDFNAPVPTYCWDGTSVYAPATCPTEPIFTCWDGSTTHYSSECPQEPSVTCWDGSVVRYQTDCSPTPPPITCWNGSVVDWNQTCPQMPPPVECWDGSEVNWDQQCPDRTLNPPTNIYGEVRVDGVYISWDAPQDSGTAVERYAVSWMCEGCAGYGWSSNATSVLIPFSTFTYTGGVGINYTFSIRADNDSTSTYSINVTGPTLLVVEPIIPSPEPTPSESNTPEQTPTPEPTASIPQPVESPSSPSPTPSSSSSGSPLQPEVPAVTPSPTPEQQTSFPEPLVPDPVESPSPDPIEPSSLPSDNDTIDGLTAEEEAALNELLTEYGPMDAISFEDFEASGLDYENLPPDQPVMLENGVVLTAEVADAIEMFEDPSELLLTVLTDPGKALKAFANIGADMTPIERDESQKVIVAAVIAGQLMNGLSAANNIGRKL